MLVRNRALLKIACFVLVAYTVGAYSNAGSDSKPTHDVAITKVSVPSSCAAGDTIPVTISIGNQGTGKETFRVILTDHTGGKEIASQEVTLAKGWKDGSEGVADLVFDAETDEVNCMGGRVCAEGDSNTDGYNDLIITASEWNGTQGRAYLYLGGPNVKSSPHRVFTGESVGDHYGDLGATFGDVNNDGYDDIIICARGYHDNDGLVHVYYGGEPMDAVCDKTFTGETSRDEFSSAVFLSDIDADGLSDVLIAARFAADYRGRVYIYWGANDFDGSSPDLILEGEQRSHVGGDEIAFGYFNNDEYGDILVGAFGYPDPHYPENRMGRAYIFNGNARGSMDQLADHIFEGESGHAGRFGLAVSSGDLNNDNYDDVVVGAWGYNNRQGRAYLYYGPFESSTDITFNWDTTNATPGKHILKASIAPVAGEEDVADNTMTVTVEVKGRQR